MERTTMQRLFLRDQTFSIVEDIDLSANQWSCLMYRRENPRRKWTFSRYWSSLTYFPHEWRGGWLPNEGARCPLEKRSRPYLQHMYMQSVQGTIAHQISNPYFWWPRSLLSSLIDVVHTTIHCFRVCSVLVISQQRVGTAQFQPPIVFCHSIDVPISHCSIQNSLLVQ